MLAPRKLALQKGEIIASFLLPARPAKASDAYLRFIPRTEMDIAVVGCGISLTLDASGTSLVMHLVPIIAATELWLLAANHPYNDRRTKQRQPYLALWRARIIWTGLAPVFAKATILAIINGPNRKPVYKVTRKHNDLRWHAAETMPQMLPLLAVGTVAIYATVQRTLPSPLLLLATMYWGALNVVLLAGFVTRGWHGLERLPFIERRRAKDDSTVSSSADVSDGERAE